MNTQPGSTNKHKHLYFLSLEKEKNNQFPVGRGSALSQIYGWSGELQRVGNMGKLSINP